MANPSILKPRWTHLGSHHHQALRPAGSLATSSLLTSWKFSSQSLKTLRRRRRRRQQHGSHLLEWPEQRKECFRTDSKVMGRRVGGVSHEFGKYCQAAEQDPAQVGPAEAPQPSGQPLHKALPRQNQRKATIKGPLPKIPNDESPLLSFRSAVTGE